MRAIATINGVTLAGTAGKGAFIYSGRTGSWTSANTNLTDTIVLSFAVSGSVVFAGTNSNGVFMSANSGGVWAAVNTGLTVTYINSLAICGRTLFATDFAAGGMWQRPLSDMTAGTQAGSSISPLKRTSLPVSFQESASVVSIGFRLARQAPVAASVYALSGRKAALLLNATILEAGAHTLQWDSQGFAKGCYIVKLQAGFETVTRNIPILY